MIALLFRRWLLFAIGIPLLAWLIDQMSTGIEQRRGQSGVTSGMRKTSDQLRSLRRGRKGKKGGRRLLRA